MSAHNPNETFSLPADAVIALYSRVKVDANGKAVLAGASDRSVGIVEAVSTPDAVTGACAVTVRSHTGGTRWFIAGAAVTKGATVTGIASGKVDGTAVAGAEILGVALEAAAADGDIIEVALTHTPVVPAGA